MEASMDMWHSRIRAFVILLLGSTALTLAALRPALAGGWVLALPPSKDTVPAGRDPRKVVGEALDRDAPITDWSRGLAYASGEACEDARLQAITDFDGAAEALGGRDLSSKDRAQLMTLGRRAFGRCVPAFAFDERGAAAGRNASVGGGS
jgi:hypothetical protein